MIRSKSAWRILPLVFCLTLPATISIRITFGSETVGPIHPEGLWRYRRLAEATIKTGSLRLFRGARQNQTCREFQTQRLHSARSVPESVEPGFTGECQGKHGRCGSCRHFYVSISPNHRVQKPAWMSRAHSSPGSSGAVCTWVFWPDRSRLHWRWRSVPDRLHSPRHFQRSPTRRECWTARRPTAKDELWWRAGARSLYLPSVLRSGRSPVLLAIHGPTGQARPLYDPAFQYLLTRGIAVFDRIPEAQQDTASASPS